MMAMAMPNDNSIHVLPKDVVDKIAAGEVVQRASAALKEMIENSLDAHATEIHVVVHSVSAFTLTDNGDGIPKDDLALACTRHATSKLRAVDDLSSIASFGFRGEALASISMVAQVEIHSRTKNSPVGYTQRYVNGRPTSSFSTSSLSSPDHHLAAPTASARKVGTTIRVTNLFHNMPTRQSLRLANEYAAMLKVVQCYAVHYPAIAFVCQKVDKPADLITKPTLCVTDTASALFGLDGKPHAWLDHARELREENSNNKEVESSGSLIYQAQLYLHDASSTNSSNNRRAAAPARLPFLLFVNDRLVSNTTLQGAVEQVIADHSHHQNHNKKSFVYLSIHVPPHQVDVNVHPTKQSVVLYHLDRIATDLAESLKAKLVGANNVTSMAAHQTLSASSLVTTKKKMMQPTLSSSLSQKRASPASDDGNYESCDDDDDDDDDKSSDVDDDDESPTAKRPKTTAGGLSLKKNEPKVRMNTNAGALDSFIVPKQRTMSTTQQGYHHPSCPVDMSQPGAFALRDCRCADIRNPPVCAIVVKPLTPTPCLYASIRQLRNSIGQRCHTDAMKRLRQAAYVGPVSQHRSLLQIGPDLVLWSHTTAATHLFRQLALYKFGDCPLAALPLPGVDIGRVIAHLLHVEEQESGVLPNNEDEDDDNRSSATRNSVPSEANQRQAEQVTACLIQNKDMLLEYFSIRIDNDKAGTPTLATLTGLPILLDGHAPDPGRLPLFLLRLATCVDYQQERACFDGVCRELGIYYGSPSSLSSNRATNAKELFPAIRALLQPPNELELQLQPLTSLKECYKVFERC